MRASLALLLLAPLLFAGCIKAPAQGLATNAAPTVPVANTTLPKADVKPVELKVSTTGQYPVNPGFDPASLSVSAGSMVNVTFTNNDPLFQHNWVLEKADGAKTADIGTGACAPTESCTTANVLFAAPPKGTYKYYCSIGDHRQRGMEGTLTVA